MRRPPAGELAKRLRLAKKPAAAPAPRAIRPADSAVNPVARIIPALLAALFAGWTASTLPFYPTAWPVGLALLAAVLTAFSPRGGLAFALFVPVFPLGNHSMGLALLYGGLAALWFVLHLREPRTGFAFVFGPLLAPVAALGLLPLALQPVRSGVRRALQAGTAVLMAGLVAGLQHGSLPFAGGQTGPLGLDGERSPLHAASLVRHALVVHPTLALEALVLAAAAALLPLARRRGLWGIAIFGAGLIAASVLAAPHADPIPPVVTAWVMCIAVVLWERRSTWAFALSPRIDRLD